MCLLQGLAQRWVLVLLCLVVDRVDDGSLPRHLAQGLVLTGRLLVSLAEWVGARSLETAPPTTLYSPSMLQSTLQRFAEVPPVLDAGSPGGRRDPATPPTGTASEHHRTETLCRAMLEAMLDIRLPKARPRWLVNPTTKRPLELDMYCEALRIAFEVDGSQHEVYSPHFHQSEDHFRYRQLLDRLKTQLCQEAGVLLIRIPWHRVSALDEERTARCLEELLRAHRIPFRSLLARHVSAAGSAS